MSLFFFLFCFFNSINIFHYSLNVYVLEPAQQNINTVCSNECVVLACDLHINKSVKNLLLYRSQCYQYAQR